MSGVLPSKLKKNELVLQLKDFPEFASFSPDTLLKWSFCLLWML
jgi:hypothetical protein